MAPRRARRSDEQHVASSPPPSDPPTFAAAVCRIAVAQICVDAGFTAVEPSALRALEDVAARHLAALGRSAASAAAAGGRTDANIHDLVRALEDLAAPRGFRGAADPTRPLLRSAPLRELMAFVEASDEVPFPKPTRRREIVGAGERPGKEDGAMRWTSFAEVGSEPPFRHVPRWLPSFPPAEQWERKGVEEEEKKMMTTSPEEEPVMPAPVAANGGERSWPVKRENIKFRLGKRGRNETRRLKPNGAI